MVRKKVKTLSLLGDGEIQAMIERRELESARSALGERLAADETDAYANFLLGACHMNARDYEAACDSFQKAATARPETVFFHTSSAVAALALRRPEDAKRYAEAALAVAPEDLAALLQFGNAQLQLKDYVGAVVTAEKLRPFVDQLPQMRQLMGDALRGLGRLPEAGGYYEAILELDPDNSRARLDSAICQARMGAIHHAIAVVTGMLDQVPDEPEILTGLGIQAQEEGAPHLALVFFRYCFTHFPKFIDACMNLGITIQAMGNPGESLYYFRRALELDEEISLAHYYSGQAYQAMRLPEKAEDCFHRCIELDEKNAEALANLASLVKEKGQIDYAKKLLRQAIEANPKWLQPYLNLYHFLKENDELEAAAEVLDQAGEIEGNAEALRHTRADLCLKRGDVAGATALFREILAGQPQNPDAMSGMLFCMNYDAETAPEVLAEAYKDWDRRFAKWRAPAADFEFPNDRDPDRRLRIGYVSGDFRGHSVAFFAEPILQNHNHEQFEVYCYANQKGGDQNTQRMLGMADQWRWILDLNDPALIEMIRLDEIDILIDLSNHTAYHRLYAFAHKPAPIQMTWLGMPTTTGLSAIDYRITDAGMDPEGMTENLHSEKLLRLVSGWCYRPSDEAVNIEVGELPALRNGHLSFASFNAFGKINPHVFAIWGRILRAIPDAVLYVATGAKDDDEVLNSTVRNTCKENGVPLERLRLLGRKPMKEYFDFHNEIDIVLDPFPYNGGTVTAHALWMSKPVISLAGRKPIGRMGVSMLTSVGLEDFIAQTEDEYVQIAVDCSKDIEKLARITRELRPAMIRSPLMDGELVTADLEKEMRRVWREWCENNPLKTEKELES